MTTYLEQSRSGVWDVPASFLPRIYFDGVTQAGGIATLLPPQPVNDDVVTRVLDGLDGLVLTGGKDVDPARYGQPRHPANDEPRADRDAWEFALLSGALRRDMPVLGICRGAQVLNIAFGGSLHQHLPDVLGNSGHQPGNAVFARSEVRVLPGSRLVGLIGPTSTVECYHHQAVAEVGAGLAVVAHSSDGVIEAVEKPGEAFVLGVQWHPEERLEDLRLFAGVVAAAKEFAMSQVGA